jgi:hypothetical protein
MATGKTVKSLFKQLGQLHLEPEVPDLTRDEMAALHEFENAVIDAADVCEQKGVDKTVVLAFLLEYGAKLNEDLIKSINPHPGHLWFKEMALRTAQNLFEAADHNIRMWVFYKRHP